MIDCFDAWWFVLVDYLCWLVVLIALVIVLCFVVVWLLAITCFGGLLYCFYCGFGFGVFLLRFFAFLGVWWFLLVSVFLPLLCVACCMVVWSVGTALGCWFDVGLFGCSCCGVWFGV